MNEGKE